MKTINEQIKEYLLEHLSTAEYAEYDVEVDDWSVDWSGSGSLNIDVMPDGVTVNEINGHYLSDVFIMTRSQFENALDDFEPEAKDEECITADDIRYILGDLRVLTEHNEQLREVDTEHVVQLILSRSSARKQGY